MLLIKVFSFGNTYILLTTHSSQIFPYRKIRLFLLLDTLTLVNETCTFCKGSVVLERTCLRSTNCTRLNNDILVHNETEIIERSCSITENIQAGGCIPGIHNYLKVICWSNL